MTHHPFVFHIGPLAVTGFGIAVLAAFAIAQLITQRELERRGQDARAVPDLLLAAVVGTLVGAKLYFVLIITHDWHSLFSRSGFVFWGGFIGASLAVWLMIWRRRLGFMRIADVAGIAVAAGYAVGRTGCWAIGDDYGKPWNGALAVAFPQGAPPSTVENMRQIFHVALPANLPPDAVLSVYPTQLMEVALGLVMFGMLWRLRDHRHAVGWLFGVYLVLAGIERFIVEFFRAKDDRFLVFNLFTSQGVAIAVTVAGLVWMYALRHTGPGKPGIRGGTADRRATAGHPVTAASGR
ncbi:MAG TPA: prolipoprotein diacylglyceryl transferase [Gemmatimonadaceae bacterium]|nr:prolipoprotein diacylglyceryl transferase [Gemmatimonadaceae bacterium]